MGSSCVTPIPRLTCRRQTAQKRPQTGLLEKTRRKNKRKRELKYYACFHIDIAGLNFFLEAVVLHVAEAHLFIVLRAKWRFGYFDNSGFIFLLVPGERGNVSTEQPLGSFTQN